MDNRDCRRYSTRHRAGRPTPPKLRMTAGERLFAALCGIGGAIVLALMVYWTVTGYMPAWVWFL